MDSLSLAKIPPIKCSYVGEQVNKPSAKADNPIASSPELKNVTIEHLAAQGDYSKTLYTVKEKMERQQNCKDALDLYTECAAKIKDIISCSKKNDNPNINVVKKVDEKGRLIFTRLEKGKIIDSAVIDKDKLAYISSSGKLISVVKGNDSKGNEVIVISKQDDTSAKGKTTSYIVTYGKDAKKIEKKVY